MYKNFIITALIVSVLSIISCSDSVGKSDIDKVWDDYIKTKVESMQKGNTLDDGKLQDEAAKMHGFKDWGFFREKAIKDLGPNKWNELSRAKSMEFAREVGKILPVKKEEKK